VTTLWYSLFSWPFVRYSFVATLNCVTFFADLGRWTYPVE
jgi:hypothetical protein